MNSPSTNIWARLVALNPDKEDIHLSSQPEDHNEYYKPDIGWKIYQKSTGETLITNLSASSIKINDDWLEVAQEKEIFGGERVSFNKDKDNADEDFDYVFHIMNQRSSSDKKRKREDSLGSTQFPSSQEITKLNKIGSDLQQELTCSICMRILYKCATLSPCQHSFCSSCAFDSLKRSTCCPLCRVEATSVTKNLALHNLVELTLKNFPDLKSPEGSLENEYTELVGNITKTSEGIYIGFLNSNGRKEGRGRFIYKDGKVYEGNWRRDEKEGEGILTLKNGERIKGTWTYDVLEKNVEISFPNDNTYKGEFRNFQCHGKGVMRYHSGAVYDGNWAWGYYDGWGKLTKNGDEYEGMWRNGKKNGTGTMKYSNGNVYQGNWKEDKRDGKGVLTLGDGDKYEGSFENNLYNGAGKYTWADGDEFEGRFIDCQKVGYGVYKHANGDIYRGNWKDDEKNGEGIFTKQNGESYVGSFSKGRYSGKGKYSWSDGREYDGDWIDGRRNGTGTLRYADGKVYKGEWKDHKKEGNGILILSNGDRYEGSWVNDVIQPVVKVIYANGSTYEGEIEVEALKKQGKGVFISNSGDQYDGEWINDKQHGKGKKTWKEDQCTYEGVWEDGKISGNGVMTYADGSKFEMQWKKVEEVGKEDVKEVEGKQEAMEQNQEEGQN